MSLHTSILEAADYLAASASPGPEPFDRTQHGPDPQSVVVGLIRRAKFLEKVAEDRARTIDSLLKAAK